MTDEIDDVRLQGYKSNFEGTVAYNVLSIITLGVFTLLCQKYPELGVYIRLSKSSFQDASTILVSERTTVEVPVHRIDGLRYFEYKKQRYTYNQTSKCFVLQPAILQDLMPNKIHEHRNGMNSQQAIMQSHLSGTNRILIDDVPVLTMLVLKCSQAFYLFQMASVSIWLYQGYLTYAIIILVMSVASVLWEVYSAKMNEIQLRALTKYEADFFVLRDGDVRVVPSEELVIGDAVIFDAHSLPPDAKVPCDMVLIQGEVVMDESSLTGETIPIMKLPVPIDAQTKLDPEKDRKHILYGGSTIKQLKPKDEKFRAPDYDDLRSRSSVNGSSDSINQEDLGIELDALPSKKKSVIAIVLATGFTTAKGQLFRSILFPHEIEFKYNQDSMKFMAILGFVAIVAFLNRAYDSFKAGQTFWVALFNSLDLITIAVPPALPLILTVGIGFSLQRLKEAYIYCINPERLNYAGRLDTMCWDKTGTITISKLLFEKVDLASKVKAELNFTEKYVLENPNSIERFMAVCHGVTKNGRELLGHSLDIETFSTTGWEIASSHPETIKYQGTTAPVIAVIQKINPIYIIRRFDFDAHLQRSSVVSYCPTDNCLHIMTKGSPESIKQVCNPESIPTDFDILCSQYSIEGFYVIACAVKQLQNAKNFPRTVLESNLTFIGFLLFRNPLKPISKQVFSKLKKANIKSIIMYDRFN